MRRMRACDSAPDAASTGARGPGLPFRISRSGPSQASNAPSRNTRRGTVGGRSVDRADPAANLSYDLAVSQIGDAVARASAYLTEHPDEARYRDSAATAKLGRNLRVDVTGPGGEKIATDMPRGIGGQATVPSPGWLLRAASASCVASLIGIRAASLGLDIASGGVEVTVDSESDDRGILGLDDAIAAGALSMKVVVRFGAGEIGGEAREALARWALNHCPVSDPVARPVPIELEVS